MKTYTFFYYDTDNVDETELKKYSVFSPRFDSAFKSFSNFILFHESDYIRFFYTYNIFNGHKTQVRSLSTDNILHLTALKYRRNSSTQVL